MKFKTWVITFLIGAMMVISTIGCHTVKGAGKDIEAGGEAIQDVATPNK